MTSDGSDYDVAIVGGSISGAGTATILLRERPDLRVLIVEKSAAFGRGVGESTVEVSAYYLSHVLELSRHLNEEHLVKHGMRFWFANDATRTLDQCSEIGNRYQLRVPTYQVDRARLNEEVLRRAVARGAALWREAHVVSVELNDGGTQRLTVQRGADTTTVGARWVIDGSGPAALLARRNGWWQANTAHPVSAIWARFRGVRDWDEADLRRRNPSFGNATFTLRCNATNHLTGDGWWAWLIPLRGGDVSVGVVFDERRVEFPIDGALGERLKEFLLAHPAGREILGEAAFVEGDVHRRRNLAYRTTRFAGDGFALVGDAAAFMDPLYSPGLDWVSYTSSVAADLVLAQRRGEDVAPRLERLNRQLAQSYDRWFEALYRDKYEYLGEFDLMRIAFQLDVGLYYFGVASEPYRRGPEAFLEPMFSQPSSRPFFRFMRFYNRRLAAIARSRRARHALGRHNSGERAILNGFTFARSSVLKLGRAFVQWGRLELEEWRLRASEGPSRDAANS
ncbi:NAD(P)/FAD-dependent oxidoreductase [Candidatus Binatia bacterium]|nr:NAD(P)/FAD-dependent oxidoreductase [Candidatus Binatia bacterium]